MAYFPFFMDLSAGDGLIVGGGRVALRKIEKLLPYAPRLTVCAPEPLPEIGAISGLTVLRRAFEPSMVDGRQFVIAATDDRGLNRRISALCQEKHILVNVVDDRDVCTFLFPALVKRGPLSIGISTGGASPSAAVYWKEQIGGLIPGDTGGMLDYLNGLRDMVKESIPNEKDRSEAFSALFNACMESGWPLDVEALARLLSDARGGRL